MAQSPQFCVGVSPQEYLVYAVQAIHNIRLILQNEPKRSRANSYELFRIFPNS